MRSASATVHFIRRSACACRPSLPALARCAGLPVDFANKMFSSAKDDTAAAKPVFSHPHVPRTVQPPPQGSQQLARPHSRHADDQDTMSGINKSVVAADNGRGDSLVSRETRQTHVERRRCSQGIIRCVAHETFILSCARPFARAAPLLEIACEDIVFRTKRWDEMDRATRYHWRVLGWKRQSWPYGAETDENDSRRTIYRFPESMSLHAGVPVARACQHNPSTHRPFQRMEGAECS